MNNSPKPLPFETYAYKVIFPETLNHHQTLFGGRALSLMAESAFVTATRFCRKNLVMVNCEHVQFLKPVPASTIAEIKGEILKVGTKSITVKVTVSVETMMTDVQELAIHGTFVLVAVNEDGKSISVK